MTATTQTTGKIVQVIGAVIDVAPLVAQVAHRPIEVAGDGGAEEGLGLDAVVLRVARHRLEAAVGVAAAVGRAVALRGFLGEPGFAELMQEVGVS